jgi:TonB family protein
MITWLMAASDLVRLDIHSTTWNICSMRVRRLLPLLLWASLAGCGPAAVGGAGPGARGQLSKDEILEVIGRHVAEIRYCYEEELERNRELAGRVVVHFVIEASGGVAGARIARSTANSPALERCMLDAIRAWRFPPPRGGGGVEVNYPFVFKSRERGGGIRI